MGAAVLRQEGMRYEYWDHPQFHRPWVHYLPVDHYFNHMAAVVAWANAHPAEALPLPLPLPHPQAPGPRPLVS